MWVITAFTDFIFELAAEGKLWAFVSTRADIAVQNAKGNTHTHTHTK